MSSKPKHHATISFERFFPETPACLFAEFADPVARAKWSAPTGDALVYDETDFKVGGRDFNDAGLRATLSFELRPDTWLLNLSAVLSPVKRWKRKAKISRYPSAPWSWSRPQEASPSG